MHYAKVTFFFPEKATWCFVNLESAILYHIMRKLMTQLTVLFQWDSELFFLHRKHYIKLRLSMVVVELTTSLVGLRINSIYHLWKL